MEGTYRRASRQLAGDALTAFNVDFDSVDSVEELDRTRRRLVGFCLETTEVLGALTVALTSSGQAQNGVQRSKLCKVLEDVLSRVCACPVNEVPVVQGLLMAELSCAQEVSTLLRGNSVVSRLVVAVLKRQVGLNEAVERWLARRPPDAGTDGEAAARDLVATLRAEQAQLPPQLRAVMGTVALACDASPLLAPAKTQMLGGILFLRLVCPMLIAPCLATAKALQTASNQHDKHPTPLGDAVRQLLLELVADAKPREVGRGENNLHASDALRLIQLLALHRDAIIELWVNKKLADPALVSAFRETLKSCDPFKASVSKSVLSRTSSPSLIERERHEKDFFSRHGLPAAFLETYFAAAPGTIEVDSAVRVATFCSNVKFGVPEKKGVFVGRDLVDWLVERAQVDRAKGVWLASDLLLQKLVVCVAKDKAGKKKGTAAYRDDDTFYCFDRHRIDQLNALLSAAGSGGSQEDEIAVSDRCPQCMKQGKRPGRHCQYCGYE